MLVEQEERSESGFMRVMNLPDEKSFSCYDNERTMSIDQSQKIAIMDEAATDLIKTVDAKLSNNVEFLALHETADKDGTEFMFGALLPELRQLADECDMRRHRGSFLVHGRRLFALVFTEPKVTTAAGVTVYVNKLTQVQLLAAVTADCEPTQVSGEMADDLVVICHARLLRAALVRAVAKALVPVEHGQTAIPIPRSVWRLLYERSSPSSPSMSNEFHFASQMLNLPDVHAAPPNLPRHEFSDRLGDPRLCAAIARYSALQTFLRVRVRQGQQSSLLVGWLYNLVRLYDQSEPDDAVALVRRCVEVHLSSQLQAVHFGRGRRNAIDPDGVQDLMDAIALVVEGGTEWCDPLALQLERARLGDALTCHQLAKQSPAERRLGAAIVQASRAPISVAERYCANVQLPWHSERLAQLTASAPADWCVLRIETEGFSAGSANERRTPLALLTALRSALPGARDGADYLLLTSPLSYDNLHHWQTTDDRETRQRELRGILARGPKRQDDLKFGRDAKEALKTSRKQRHPVPWLAEMAPSARASCALVVLADSQRLNLQVACASVLCAQRALSVEDERHWLSVRPLAAPLLADTLANSNDLGALCHALNALSAQLGLPFDAWCPYSARAQTDALRTARLCVRIATVLLYECDPAARTGDAAVASVLATLERTHAGKHKKTDEDEEDNSLVGALQVVLAGNLFPLVVPDELAAPTAAVLGEDIEQQCAEMARSVPRLVYLATALGNRKVPAANRESYAWFLSERDAANTGATAVVDCACGGASVATCERLKAALPDEAFIHGAACCLCDLEAICAPHGEGVLTDFMCSHCITRICTRAQPASRVHWVDVAHPDSTVDVLQYIDAVVTLAESKSAISAAFRQLLLRMRNRLGLWVSSTRAPRVYKKPLSAHAHTTSHTTIFRTLTQFIDSYATERVALTEQQAVKMMEIALRGGKIGGRRSIIIEATHAFIPCSAAATAEQLPANSAPSSFALGTCMSVLEVVQAWYLEPVMMLARLRAEWGCTKERAAAITSYLVPFETRQRYDAFVDSQRAGLLFPLLDSAIIEPALCGTAGNNSALNDSRSFIHQRFERLLDADLRPRPLTGTLPNMLETVLLNWHASL